MTATFKNREFADAVAGRLKFCRMDVRSAGKIVGVSAATISRVSRGAVPDVETLIALLTWLQQPLETFIEYEES